MTELIAGLLVASMLLTGIVQLTRTYAISSVRLRSASQEIADLRVIQSLMGGLERADPGTLDLTSGSIHATVGGEDVSLTIVPEGADRSVLRWRSETRERDLALAGQLMFEQGERGDIQLVRASDASALAVVRPLRDAPFDCQFDTVSRTCR